MNERLVLASQYQILAGQHQVPKSQRTSSTRSFLGQYSVLAGQYENQAGQMLPGLWPVAAGQLHMLRDILGKPHLFEPMCDLVSWV